MLGHLLNDPVECKSQCILNQEVSEIFIEATHLSQNRLINFVIDHLPDVSFEDQQREGYPFQTCTAPLY